MSEMVERMAEAIKPYFDPYWDDHEQVCKIVKIALTAMREPTAAMLESVYENCHSVKSAYEDSNVDFLADGWRAMIDTALTDDADR